MVSPWYTNRRYRLVAGIGFLFVVLAGIVIYQQPIATTSNTANTSAVRQEYASLYEAAWRQDDGNQPTLVTATVLLPPAQQALGQDTGRSTTEDQIWDIVKTVGARQVPVILTFDSVSAFVPDAVITNGTTMVIDGGPKVSLTDWKPIVAPSRVVNTSGSVRSQIGIALFTADQDVDWTSVKNIRLVVHGVPNETDRIFNWLEPRLLLEVK